MQNPIIEGRLSAQVLNGGTFTVAYPRGTNKGTFFGGVGHNVLIANNLYLVPDGIALTFGADEITVTNNTGATLGAGTNYRLELDVPSGKGISGIDRCVAATVIWCNLGAPKAADADSIAASQTPADAGALTIDGALASNGIATLDMARNVTITAAANDSARTFTVTGKDEYGVLMVEEIGGPNATIAQGKKAFKTVDSVEVDAATAGAITVGHGDVLGLPFFLADSDFVLKEMQDGTALTNGTFVAGDTATPTATTGDVRGTYDPNAATNGSLSFRLVAAITDESYKGQAQFGG